MASSPVALVIHGPPNVVSLAIDLHEHLVEVPSPPAGLHALNATLSDLGGKHRPKAKTPEPGRLMADINTALVKQVFDIPKRQREANIEHHRQADDLRTCIEVTKGRPVSSRILLIVPPVWL